MSSRQGGVRSAAASPIARERRPGSQARPADLPRSHARAERRACTALPQRVAYERPSRLAPTREPRRRGGAAGGRTAALRPGGSTHGAPRFLQFSDQEALIMAKTRTRRRRGQLSDRHESRRRSDPGAGPSDADRQFHRRAVGVDLGQGLKTVMRRSAPKRSACRPSNVIVDTADTDTGPHCMGTFASRGTHRVGNAIIMAAQEARAVMLEVGRRGAGSRSPPTSRPTARATSRSKGAPQSSISVVDVALAAHFKQGKTISGRGMFLVPRSYAEPETGEMARDLLRACLHGRRGRSRRRDRRGRRAVAEERLRDRPRAQPEDGRAADRRRRLDGHQPRALRDDRALLSRTARMGRATSTNI